ncbi:MAG: alpha/beta hydrolase [Sphingobium sp.]
MSLDKISPAPFEIDVGSVVIRGLVAGTAERGLLIALHGGGYDANYWHTSDSDAGSLMNIGAALGFKVVAVDRPGYRGSNLADPMGLSVSGQAEIMFKLIEQLDLDPGLPVFLIGHSLGGILALVMASHQKGRRLAAIDVSGVPLRFPSEMEAGIASLLSLLRSKTPPPLPTNADRANHRRAIFYGADDHFDPALVKDSGDHPTPLNELEDAFNAPVALPPTIAQIAIPIQWTIADQEKSSIGGKEMIAEIRDYMTSCPMLRTEIQVASGHNISLHHVARAYHLRAFAFFEEILALNPKRMGD